MLLKQAARRKYYLKNKFRVLTRSLIFARFFFAIALPSILTFPENFEINDYIHSAETYMVSTWTLDALCMSKRARGLLKQRTAILVIYLIASIPKKYVRQQQQQREQRNYDEK